MDTVEVLLSVCLGVSLITNIIFIPRYLASRKKLNCEKKGDLFLSSDGEMWSEFYVSFEDLAKDSTVLMGVHYIGINSK